MAKSAATTELEQKKLAREIEKIELDLERERLYFREHNEKRDERAVRRIHFNDAVNVNSIAVCLNMVDDLVRQDATAPIEIVFNSPGGGVFTGFELYDRLMEVRANGTPINTVVLGYAASMAGILAQVGQHRSIGPNAFIMIHEVASGALGKVSELRDNVELSDRLHARLLDIMAERSTLSAEEIRERSYRKDWWLDAHEALEYGFVDSILSTPTPAVGGKV